MTSSYELKFHLYSRTPESWRRRYRFDWESPGDSNGNIVWTDFIGESFISSSRTQSGI